MPLNPRRLERALGFDPVELLLNARPPTGEMPEDTPLFVRQPPESYVLECLTRLRPLFARFVIIAPYRGRAGSLVMQWLQEHRLVDILRLRPAAIYLCVDDPREWDAVARGAGVTDYISRRTEVLEHLASVPRRVAFQPFADKPTSSPVMNAQRWTEVIDFFNR